MLGHINAATKRDLEFAYHPSNCWSCSYCAKATVSVRKRILSPGLLQDSSNYVNRKLANVWIISGQRLVASYNDAEIHRATGTITVFCISICRRLACFDEAKMCHFRARSGLVLWTNTCVFGAFAFSSSFETYDCRMIYTCMQRTVVKIIVFFFFTKNHWTLFFICATQPQTKVREA